ncbi:MAG: hypothetical protein JWR68_177 [Polaromonas sp.]|nr:hypothetical protein [Polaromonas sp.]
MSIPTILEEDCKAISDNLLLALDELTDVQVIAVAETPTAAIAATLQYAGQWELMILDLFLKDGTGLNVLEACRNRLPHQHIVVLTSMATPQMRRQCLKLGADAVYDKSKELEQFFERCNLYHAT